MIKEKKKTLFVSDNFLVCCHVLQISKYCMYNVKKLRKKILSDVEGWKKVQYDNDTSLVSGYISDMEGIVFISS
jgi:hypothetical protein